MDGVCIKVGGRVRRPNVFVLDDVTSRMQDVIVTSPG